jgi:hypothetical protein
VASEWLLIAGKELAAPMMVYTASPFVGYDMTITMFQLDLANVRQA